MFWTHAHHQVVVFFVPASLASIFCWDTLVAIIPTYCRLSQRNQEQQFVSLSRSIPLCADMRFGPVDVHGTHWSYSGSQGSALRFPVSSCFLAVDAYLIVSQGLRKNPSQFNISETMLIVSVCPKNNQISIAHTQWNFAIERPYVFCVVAWLSVYVCLSVWFVCV